MKTKTTAALVLLVLLVMCMGIWRGRLGQYPEPMASSSASVTAIPPTPTGDIPAIGEMYVPAAGGDVRLQTVLPEAQNPDGSPRSLGEDVDASGHLRLSANVRLKFDLYLERDGLVPSEAAIAGLRQAIAEQMPPLAASEASRVLDDYLAYKSELGGFLQQQVPLSLSDTVSNRQRMEDVRRIRDRHLDATVSQAFFEHEDSYSNYLLSGMDIQNDASLTPSQKAEKLAALKQGLR